MAKNKKWSGSVAKISIGRKWAYSRRSQAQQKWVNGTPLIQRAL